jgi:hypothetical protein
MRFIDLLIVVLVILVIGWIGLKNKNLYGETEEFMVSQENYEDSINNLTEKTPIQTPNSEITISPELISQTLL